MKNLTCISSQELWHFIIDEPLLAYLLLRSDIQEVKGFNGVAAVQVRKGKPRLILNPDIIAGFSSAQKIGVLVHEFLHILLKHCTKRAYHKVGPKAIKQNVAMDQSINQIIRQTWELPSFVIYHDSDPYNYPPKLSAEQYFQLIDSQFTDEEFQNMYGDLDTFDRHEWDGSPEDDASIDELLKSYFNSKRGDRVGKSLAAGGLSRGSLEAIRATGTNEIDWALRTKAFLSQAASNKRRRTYKRPSRRHGFPFQGTKAKKATKALAIIDTSFSMTGDVLGYVLTNLNAMSRIMKVDTLMCDTNNQGEITKFSASDKLEFKGRGGTDLQPAFDKALEDGYKAVIVFTDGDLCKPIMSNINTLWVAIGNDEFKPKNGEVCYVNWK